MSSPKTPILQGPTEPSTSTNEPAPIPVQNEEPVVEKKLSGKKKRLIRVVKGAAGIKKNAKPFLAENSLSIIERYFHHMPVESAQVNIHLVIHLVIHFLVIHRLLYQDMHHVHHISITYLIYRTTSNK